MQLTNELHPSELFRYVHLRNAQKQPKIKKTIEYVKYSDTPSEATLYKRSLAKKDDTGAYSLIMGLCEGFRASGSFLSNAENIDRQLPNLRDLIGELRTEIRYSETWISEVEAVLGTSIEDYKTSNDIQVKKEILWDNLVYQILRQENGAIIAPLLQCISAIYLLENVSRISNDTEIQQFFKARVLLPEWIAVLIKTEKQKTADNHVGTESRVTPTPTNSRLPIIRKAITELSLLQSYKQYFTPVLGEGEIHNPLIIVTRDLTRFSTETIGLLSDLGISAENASIQNTIQYLQTVAGSEERKADTVRRNSVTRIGGTLLRTNNICTEIGDTDPCAENARKQYESGGSFVNTIYVGDLLVTQQQLLRYDLGEVAHIENVMASEKKTRTHRRLDRTELTETTEHETENETEHETQTTERFSMEKEASKVVQESMNVNASVTATASYGTVASIQVSAGFGYNTSSTESNNQSMAFSKQVSDRALTRVKERVREMRSLKMVHEIEEIAGHTFDNVQVIGGDAPEHINGVFRWVDKYYLNKIVNYGKRLMLEFTIPEPANFYIFRSVNQPAEGTHMDEPQVPSLTDCTQINIGNYLQEAAKYGVTDAPIPPPGYRTISEAFTLSLKDQNDDTAVTKQEMLVPSGYIARTAFVRPEYTNDPSNSFEMVIQVADQRTNFTVEPNPTAAIPIQLNLGIGNIDNDKVPVSIKIWGALRVWEVKAIVNVTIVCSPSFEIMWEWQQKVYAKIIEAYNTQKQAYDEWVNAQQSATGFNIKGNNPDINRQIEREELKKRCLEMFTGQRFDSFDAATNGIYNASNYPEILFKEAIEEGRIVESLEQIFDWDNMTYVFYPYFYGRKPNWQVITSLKDNDPLFSNFLKAGYAKAVVPVRKGFEELVLLTHMINVLFVGGELAQVPGVDTDAYTTLLSDVHTLAQEAEHEAMYNEANVIGTYIQKVPTNLVFLTADLPAATPSVQKLPDNSAQGEMNSYL